MRFPKPTTLLLIAMVVWFVITQVFVALHSFTDAPSMNGVMAVLMVAYIITDICTAR